MTHTLASVSVSQSVQNLLNTVAHSLPKIAVFLLVMVVGWLVAGVVRRALQALLHRLSFDRVAERGAIGPVLASRGYSASSLLARLVYYAVLLVTLQLAFGVFGPNPVSTMLNGMVSWLPKAFVAIILIVVASAIAKVVKDLLSGVLAGLSYGRFVASTAAVVIVALGVIAALNQIDVAATVTQPILIAVLATAGAILAIGIGGGMVRPMEQRWERILTAAERETASLAAYQRGRQDALRSPGALAGAGGGPDGDTGREAGVYASPAGYMGATEQAGPQAGGYAGPQAGRYAGPQPGAYPGPEPGGYTSSETSRYAGQGTGEQAWPEAGGYPPRGPGMPPPPQHQGTPGQQ